MELLEAAVRERSCKVEALEVMARRWLRFLPAMEVRAHLVAEDVAQRKAVDRRMGLPLDQAEGAGMAHSRRVGRVRVGWW